MEIPVDLFGEPMLKTRGKRSDEEPIVLGKPLRCDLYEGDCLDVLPRLVSEGLVVDAVVTDPPYGLEFMGKEWDKLTVYAGGNPSMKRHNRKMPVSGQPGVTYGAPQKMPRCRKCGKLKMGNGSCKCPVADFSYRHDESGFQIQSWHEVWARAAYDILKPGGYLLAFGGTRTHHRIWCAIEDAGFMIQDTIMWLHGQGFPKGRAQLKPAFEPICVAYKPGGKRTLQIDECRIGSDGGMGNVIRQLDEKQSPNWGTKNFEKDDTIRGRYPANVFHDGSGEVMEAFAAFGDMDDSGSAARFFYTAKAGAEDRHGSDHPTVKPISLLRWLVPLVVPRGGLILDPFAGTGTIGAAALETGRNAILVEREAGYCVDIRRRLEFYATGSLR